MSTPSPQPHHPPHARFLKRLVHFFSSFGLATVVLILLLLVTLLGTLEQVEHGLFDTTHKYFDSLIIPNIDLACCLRAFHFDYKGQWLLPLPLPGGYLLMAILFLNLSIGAVLRMRKTPRNAGIILSHVAILFMLVAGFVSFYFKMEGNMALMEGQTSDEFQSYHDSVIQIQRLSPAPEAGKSAVLVIDGSEYEDLSGDKARAFTSNDLPFDLIVMNYEPNAEPRRVKAGESRNSEADGYYIQAIAKKPEDEANLDAAYVKIVDKKTKAEQTGIIWRAAAAPFSFKVGDDVYGIDLTRRKFKLPFAVRLDKFDREVHPGTELARRYTSHIVQLKGGHEDKKIITMNAPLREHAPHFWEGNYVLFQASFVPPEHGVLRSVFAVVRNPSDQWPLWALIAAIVGLLYHMVGRLARFLRHSSHPKHGPLQPPPIPPAGPA